LPVYTTSIKIQVQEFRGFQKIFGIDSFANKVMRK
jgi:hypothetical protein